MTDLPESLILQLDRLAAVFQGKAGWRERLQSFCTGLEMAGSEAAMAGFAGLLDLCLIFKDCLEARQSSGTALKKADWEAMARWPQVLRDYLEAPTVGGRKEALLQIVSHPGWGASLKSDDVAMLKGLLDVQPASSRNQPSTELDLTVLEQTQEDTPVVEAAPAQEKARIHIHDGLPPQIRELYEVMASEMLNIRDSTATVMNQLRGEDVDAGAISQSLQDLAASLQLYGDAVGSVDMKGLGEIVALARANLQSIDSHDAAPAGALINLLYEWTDAVLAHLQNPADPVQFDRLIQCIRDPRWPQPADEVRARAITALHQAQNPGAAGEEKSQQPRLATAADVSIALQSDVDHDLLDAMLQELPAQTEALSAALQRLSNGGTQEDILAAKRIAHTLKGAGNTVGIRGIATLTHHLEDILLALHKHETLPSPRIAGILMNAADCLSAMSESLLGHGDPPADAQETLQAIFDMVSLIEREGIAALASVEATPTPVTGTTTVPAANDKVQLEKIPEERETAPVLRVPSDFVDALLRQVGESKIMTGRIHNSIQEALHQLKDMQDYFDQLRQVGGKVEELTDIKNLNQIQPLAGGSRHDTLEMEQYSELYSHSKRLTEIAMDAIEVGQAISTKLAKLRELLAVQARFNNETEENVIRVKMLPADTHVQRLQRCVRQAAKLAGKQVELHLEGGDTLMDSETLNALLDPIMHLLRNAVDHGIESADERAAQGKPPAGHVHLKFSREGNHVLVQCRDDGGGLDLDAIRRKAIDQGLLKEGEMIDEGELKQFILRPNFSTKEKVTQLSGRGIGMDAVYVSIMDMSGTLSIESENHKGCTVHIRLPQTTVSIFGLQVRMGPRMLVIANRDIAQIVHHENGKLRNIDERWVFRTGKQEYPATAVENLLNTSYERRAADRHPRTAILFDTDTGRQAVMVDRIVSSSDFVVKGLGDYIPKIPGIAGITLLSDGTLTPVVNVGELLRRPLSHAASTMRHTRSDFHPAKLPTALVVDDSLSARRSLVHFMQDAGFEVRQARDGIEAMDLITAHVPDIVLSDLEMPRMNGLELVGHLRASVSTAHLPFIMITSRAVAKHQQEALAAGANLYLTKPYSEDQLLEEIRRLQALPATRESA
ncbi:MAG TPA: response regulator [Gammaproteobacteria bacterium]|nr:response regulator [Gammaproteobacteria bacterium]